MLPIMAAFLDQPGARLARGVCRFLTESGAAPLTEFALARARDGAVIVVECKASIADFRADRKWTGYLEWCDEFYFATPEEFPLELLPEEEGVISADAFGAEILRPARPRRLAPARRKALTLRIARTAAERLRAAIDPAPIG